MSDPFPGAALRTMTTLAAVGLLATAARGQAHDVHYDGVESGARFGFDLDGDGAADVAIAIPRSGAILTGAIPDDPDLLGVPLHLQVIETDAVASKGVSFSAGLEIDLGVDYLRERVSAEPEKHSSG